MKDFMLPHIKCYARKLVTPPVGPGISRDYHICGKNHKHAGRHKCKLGGCTFSWPVKK